MNEIKEHMARCGKSGGASRSPAKVAASAANAAKARASRMSKADVRDLAGKLRAGDVAGIWKLIEGKAGAK